MKTAEQVKPNYAPVYAAALYPDMAEIFVKHGYALAVHGSLRRDFDLIAVPWVKSPSDPDVVLAEITKTFFIRQVDGGSMRDHGRKAYSISVGFGECAIDLSFFPGLVLKYAPARPWYVRLWRRFFPLKGIEVPADGVMRSVTLN